MRAETFIDAIRSTMAQWAEQSLHSPNTGAPDKSFEYGRVCGIYQGMTMALGIAESIIEREENDIDDDE